MFPQVPRERDTLEHGYFWLIRRTDFSTAQSASVMLCAASSNLRSTKPVRPPSCNLR